jgi:sugar lactone lactonase YvrE
MKPIFFLIAFFLSFHVLAVTPQFWEETTQQEFSSGDPQMISITSEGELMLAPQMKETYQGTESILWKLVSDGQNLYAGSGNEGKIIKIDAAGKASVLLDTNELEVQSLAFDHDGNLYAGTSPDGKIYKITRDGKSSIFFDPDAKYIWSLAFDDAGNLYVGTGDQGKIYRVDKSGKGTVFADTSEANITCLLWAAGKGLLAGSDRNGILFNIEQDGKISVLFDSDQQQITSIYRSPTGEIYFAGITGVGATSSESRTIQPPPPPVQQPQTPAQPPSDDENEEPGGSEATVVTTVEVMPVTPTPSATTSRATTSQLFRINSDGTSEQLYASDDHILDIQSGGDDGSVFISTGKQSQLIRISKDKKSTILLKTSEDQITSIITGNRTFFATANPGHIYEVVQSHSSSGTFYSDVKDTGTSSSWGKLSWKGDAPAGTTISLSTRSGNTKSPDDTWSSWSSAGIDPQGQQISNPKGRFIQWKAELRTTNNQVSPILRTVRLPYLQQNLRPTVDSIIALPPGSVYKKTNFSQDTFAGEVDPVPETGQQQADAQQAMQGTLSGKADYRKGYQTVTWTSSDPNQDPLIFDVYYRSMDEKNWRLLGKDIRENVFAWDTTTIPDGTYRLQVRVSDRLANPGNFSLTNTKDSAPFNVDNSAPTLNVTQVSKSGNTVIVEVAAQDDFSAIKDLQYSITPGTWVQVFPVDMIADSQKESYRIEIKDVPAGSDQIIIKCSDQFQNVGTVRHSLAPTK